MMNRECSSVRMGSGPLNIDININLSKEIEPRFLHQNVDRSLGKVYNKTLLLHYKGQVRQVGPLVRLTFFSKTKFIFHPTTFAA